MQLTSHHTAPKGFHKSTPWNSSAPKGFTVRQALWSLTGGLLALGIVTLALSAMEREQAFREGLWSQRQAACERAREQSPDQPETPFCREYLNWLAQHKVP